MGIHYNAWYIERRAQHAVCCFSTYSREFYKFLECAGDPAPVKFHKPAAASFYGAGFVLVKTGGSYVGFQLFHRCGYVIFRAFVFFKQFFGNNVYLLVGALGREYRGYKQLERCSVLECGFFFRVKRVQDFINFRGTQPFLLEIFRSRFLVDDFAQFFLRYLESKELCGQT